MELIPIRADTFTMGSEISDDEKPPHEVTLSCNFYIAAHKTTQEQFAKVLGRKPSWFSATGGGKDKVATLDTEKFPVECVSILDALEFCNKLSEQEQRTPCYTLNKIKRSDEGAIIDAAAELLLPGGTGYRLPTEAEWEFCARAGTKSKYSFGDDERQLGEYAWYDKNSGGRTHPVGEKKPNPWGLYDMGGLVHEWCVDHWHEN
jgi:formylglycine-generating enzyme required for sulfatase activity